LKFTAKFTVVMAIIFAVASFSVAFTGFTSLDTIADPVQRADAKGFAWFWAFLGTIAVVLGGLGVWVVKTSQE